MSGHKTKGQRRQRSRWYPSACIFCGGTPLSEEHILPQWMKACFQPLPPVRSGLQERLDRNGRPSLITVTNRQGSLFTRRPKIVCKPCNEGWMSQLESSVKPTLKRMFASTECHLLTAEEGATLATWAAKTAINFEYFEYPTKISVDQDRRRQLRDTRRPPAGTFVWIGQGSHPRGVSVCRASWDVLDDPAPPGAPDDLGPRNTQLVGMWLGNVFLLVFMTSKAQAARICVDASFPGLRRIGPTPEDGAWPSGPIIDMTEAKWNALRGLLENRRAPRS